METEEAAVQGRLLRLAREQLFCSSKGGVKWGKVEQVMALWDKEGLRIEVLRIMGDALQAHERVGMTMNHMESCCDVVNKALDDLDTDVVKEGLSVAYALTHATLQLLSATALEKQPLSKEAYTLFDQVLQLREHRDVLLNSEHETMRCACIEFDRQMVLLWSDPLLDDLTFTLSAKKEFETEFTLMAEDMIYQLTKELVDPSYSALHRSLILHALTSIARARTETHYVNACLHGLLRLSPASMRQRPPHVNRSQWGRFQHAYRLCLSALLRLPAAKPFHPLIDRTRSSIGHTYKINKFPTRKQLVAPKRRIEDISDPASSAASKRRRFLVAHPTTGMAANTKAYDVVANTPASTIVDIVLHTLDKEFHVPEMETFDQLYQHLVQSQSMNQMLTRVKQPFQGLSLFDAVSDGFNTLVESMFSRTSADPRLKDTLRSAAEDVLFVTQKSIATALIRQKQDIVRKLKRSVVPPIPVMQHSQQEAAEVANVIFEHLLSSNTDYMTRVSGAEDVRNALLCKMVCLFPDSPMWNMYVQHLSEQLKDTNVEMEHVVGAAMSLLYAQTHNADVYGHLVMTFFEAVAATTNLVSMHLFLSRLPVLPDQLIGYIGTYCSAIESEDPMEQGSADVQFGIALLSSMAKSRPANRLACTELLLRFSTSAVKILREASVSEVVGPLVQYPESRDRIFDSARQALQGLLVLPDDTAGDMTHLLTLPFQLCKAHPELLRDIVKLYVACKAKPYARVVLRTLHQEIKPLVQSMGMESSEIVDLIEQVPKGSEGLCLLILHSLTAGRAEPASALLKATLRFYESTPDARFLIPILQGLSRDYVIKSLPSIIALPDDHIRAAIDRLTNAPTSKVSPSDLLIQVHLLAPNAGDPFLSNVSRTLKMCLDEPRIKDTQVLSTAMHQLLEQPTIPVMFMATLSQALLVCPSLLQFAMGSLSRLVTKRVWENRTLWRGFMSCCEANMPHSFPVILQLPRKNFSKLLDACPGVAGELRNYVETLNIRISRDLRKPLYSRASQAVKSK